MWQRRQKRSLETQADRTIYAESFKDLSHLDTIVSEAQKIVNNALLSLVLQGSPAYCSGA